MPNLLLSAFTYTLNDPTEDIKQFFLSGSTDHNNFLPIFAGMADKNLKNDKDNLDKQQRKGAGSWCNSG